MVAAGIADQVLVQLSYAIGVAHPLSIYVDTYGTARVAETDAEIADRIGRFFDLRPASIVERFGLKNPILQRPLRQPPLPQGGHPVRPRQGGDQRDRILQLGETRRGGQPAPRIRYPVTGPGTPGRLPGILPGDASHPNDEAERPCGLSASSPFPAPRNGRLVGTAAGQLPHPAPTTCAPLSARPSQPAAAILLTEAPSPADRPLFPPRRAPPALCIPGRTEINAIRDRSPLLPPRSLPATGPNKTAGKPHDDTIYCPKRRCFTKHGEKASPLADAALSAKVTTK